MSFFPSNNNTYKPQVRQEGFHLPSPPPSNPSPPPSATSPNGHAPNAFDPNSMFSIGTHFINDPFRKSANDPNMDFGDELASLMAHSPAPNHGHHQSHERSTHSPDASEHHVNGSGAYDSQGYRHNIFDISAPSSHHHNTGGHHNNGFSLPSQTHHRPDLPSLAHPSSFHDPYSPTSNGNPTSPHTSGPPPHFNSTLPALSSSLRYDPHDPPPSSYQHQIDSFSRSHHSPSPASVPGRSRSRSRDHTASALASLGEPPSTHGGPARNTRAKRGSISSTSPPRHSSLSSHLSSQQAQQQQQQPPHPHAILIPSHSGSTHRGTPTMPVSPMSLHSLSSSTTSGWFMPPGSAGGHGGGHGQEFSLPTPESLGGGGYGPFGTPQGGLGVSPKDVNGLAGMRDQSPAQNGQVMDAAAKQSRAMLANEKRRRRRESHNAVERRRRDNINEKISELATLIPECMLDPSAASQPPLSPTTEDILYGNLAPPLAQPASTGSPKEDEKGEAGGDGVVKANKGMILRKSVEYIRYLQQLVSAQASRNRELETQLQTGGNVLSPSSLASTTHGMLNGNGNANGGHKSETGETDDMGGLMLHSEVPDLSGLIPASYNNANGKGGKMGNGNGRLHDVAEGDEMDLGEDGMEGSEMGMGNGADGEGEGDAEGEGGSANGMDVADSPVSEGKESSGERGRPATRSVRRQGQGVQVKEEPSGMETS